MLSPEIINLAIRLLALLAFGIAVLLVGLYCIHRADAAQQKLMADKEAQAEAERLRPRGHDWILIRGDMFDVPPSLRPQAGVVPGPALQVVEKETSAGQAWLDSLKTRIHDKPDGEQS